MVTIIANNPFDSAEAIASSCYVRYEPSHAKKHVFADTGEPVRDNLAIHVHEQLRAMLLSPAFPCTMGRAAAAQGAYRFGFYRDANDPECLQGLCRDLMSFVLEQPTFPFEFSSFVASFETPQAKSEKEFEKMLWSVLQTINENDSQHFDWDDRWDSDPKSERFSFSFGGVAHFVIGLHAMSSRFGRRFPYPTLVFNNHEQFVRLQESEKFSTIRNVIRQRDMQLQGTINPSLKSLEAKQYSGREVGKNWKCPFKRTQPAEQQMPWD